jgi:hypothetical protein
MGSDIYTYVEVRTGGQWAYAYGFDFDAGEATTDGPFGWRNYGMFGFLADVRNYSHSPVIAQPRGVPDDLSEETHTAYDRWDGDVYSASWLTVAELLAYNYDQIFWDRRVTKQRPDDVFDGAALAEEGEGRQVTLREFLGPAFFADLDTMAKLGDPDDVRVVFWFND